MTSTELRTQVFRKLAYKKKLRGRALLSDLPNLGLRKNSRLMPTPWMPDVAQFEFTQVPFTSHWWVGPADARLVHDCPLLDLTGVGLETFSLDIMHSWHLGPVQLLVSLTLNFCIDSGLWAPSTIGQDAQDRRRVSLQGIKAELYQFYRDQRQDADWRGKGSEVAHLYHVFVCRPSKITVLSSLNLSSFLKHMLVGPEVDLRCGT